MELDNIEILDDTEINYGKGEAFSHQKLVMRAMSKCLEAGSKEMVGGYFNEKVDKFGNSLKVYVEDTRKVFIRSVGIAIEIMSCDLDNEANKSIELIRVYLDKKYKQLCTDELKDFTDAHLLIKKQRIANGIINREGTLNKELPYYQDYIGYEVEAYMELLGVLTLLTSRKGFYEEESWGA